MLKVLIVDDDAFARDNLKNLFNWEKHGFLQDEAANGHEAIEMLKRFTPDIMLTDINMPVMNGIALIEYASLNYPHLKIIALSAYDDFDYVRQSLIKGAMDYLLKHRINDSVLLNALKAAAYNENNSGDIPQLQQQLRTGKRYMKQVFIKRLIGNDFKNVNHLLHEIKKLELNIEPGSHILIVMDVDDYALLESYYSADELDSIQNTINDISTEILTEWGKAEIFHIDKGKFLFLCSTNMSSYHSLYTQLMEIINKMRKSIKNFLNITACFGISKLCKDIQYISKCCHDTEKVLMDKFYTGKDKVFVVDSTARINSALISLTIEDEKNIIRLLRLKDYHTLYNCINNLFDKLAVAKASYNSVHLICVELINIVSKTAKQYGFTTVEFYGKDEMPYVVLQRYENILDIKKWMIDLFDSVIRKMELYQIDNSFGDCTQKAIMFINRNYNRDISLNDVAEHIGISPSHLSRVFKDDFGKCFNKYLSLVRVNNAKFLLEDDTLSLKDIASRVGFYNYNYFFKVFKNIAGVTPQEYKRRYSEN